MNMRSMNSALAREWRAPTHPVCPVGRAGMLETRIRRLVFPPGRIIRPYIQPGMTVLDFGCGPGVFTLDMAVQVGASGRVIAADVQKEMLRKVEAKLQGLTLAKRVVLHPCEPFQIGIKEQVDFGLAFWVVHEVPDQTMLFHELYAILKPGAKMLIVEPPLHVGEADFGAMMREAVAAGLVPVETPRIAFCHSVVMQKPVSGGAIS
jgi:2-polyprenyl-3-methyl-5-hydroxy-6-metoxy-1,4-benzoquinol methylase